MTDREIASLEKKYPNNAVLNNGRILRRNLNDLVFIIKVNNQLNEISRKDILEKLIKAHKKRN